MCLFLGRLRFKKRIESEINDKLVLSTDQLWRKFLRYPGKVILKERGDVGQRTRARVKKSISKRHDHVRKARFACTLQTSSWSDGTAGPLAFCLSPGKIKKADVDAFNILNRGRALAFESNTKSHFMTSQTWQLLLDNLYEEAYAIQRAKHGLTMADKGLLHADGWTGYHSFSAGEDIARNAWSERVNVAQPDKQKGVCKSMD